MPHLVTSTTSISTLKDKIKVKKSNFLQRFNALNLTLFKVDLPPNYLKLNAMEEISDVWSKPPPKRHLHLYVTVLGDQWRQKWCQLDDDDQWKLFGDYWKKQNAQTTSDSLSVTLAYEERGEENPVYRLPLVPQAKNKII
ncbi:hypothetical protein V8E52_011975, partial [Russula decolorans]